FEHHGWVQRFERFEGLPKGAHAGRSIRHRVRSAAQKGSLSRVGRAQDLQSGFVSEAYRG
ncbi:MAG: hypothetical protein ACLUHD_11060, partial [Eggerthella lenta]